MSLEQSSAPTVDVDNGEQIGDALEEVMSDGWSSDIPDVNPPTSQPGQSVLDETESPGHVHQASLTSGTATSILCPNKQQSAVGGRRLKQQRVNETVEPLNAQDDGSVTAWDDCADTPLDLVTDFELGEYMVW
eukprot:1634039-Rhodomonas_salina.1